MLDDVKFLRYMLQGAYISIYEFDTDIEIGYRYPVFSVSYHDRDEIEFISEMIVSRYDYIRDSAIMADGDMYTVHFRVHSYKSIAERFIKYLMCCRSD